MGLGFGIRDPRSGIQDPGSEIRDPRSGIRDPGSEIRKKPIPDPGSGSATLLTDPEFAILTYPLTLAKPVL
jgi:hypothetical protein